jgi:translation elongation factor P/translation initiation factor 5A
MENHAEYRVKIYEIPKLKESGYSIIQVSSLELKAVKNGNTFNICYPADYQFKPCVIIRDNKDFIYQDWLPNTNIVYLLEKFDDLIRY